MTTLNAPVKINRHKKRWRQWNTKERKIVRLRDVMGKRISRQAH